MIKQKLLVCTLALTAALAAPLAQAEQSWWQSALEFVGLGEKTAEPAKPADQPVKNSPEAEAEMQRATEQESSQLMDKAKSAATAVANSPITASLTGMVTEQLGVKPATAQGALGSLFGLAKSNLDVSQFSQLSGLVPEMGTLLDAAPAVSEKAKGLTSMMGNAGKYASVLQGATTTYDQFKSLGIGTEQIPAYIDVTSKFLESQGGSDAVNIFKSGISSLTTGS